MSPAGSASIEGQMPEKPKSHPSTCYILQPFSFVRGTHEGGWLLVTDSQWTIVYLLAAGMSMMNPLLSVGCHYVVSLGYHYS